MSASADFADVWWLILEHSTVTFVHSNRRYVQAGPPGNSLRRHQGLCLPGENSLAGRTAVINLIPHDPLRQSRNDHSAARYARQAAVAIAGDIGEHRIPG